MEKRLARKICLIVPAFNEEKTIVSVLSSIKLNIPYSTIVVVDDGSTDNTSRLVRQEGVNLISLPFNLGIGGSVQTGLKFAKENGYDAAIQVDADGQHNPKYIPVLLKSLSKNDMVIGSRFIERTSYRPSVVRKSGIFIFSTLIKLTCGIAICDPTSGFRAFNKKSIDFFCKYYPSVFPEPSSIVVMLKNGMKIKEIPVEMNNRKGGESSVTAFKSLYIMLSMSLAIIMESFKNKSYYGKCN